jgi:rhodanese-related sulfurtransferase
MKPLLRWSMLILGLTVTLGAGTIAAIVAQPNLLRPLAQAGLPISVMDNLPFLGDAALAAAADQISPIDLKQALTDPKRPVLVIDVRTPAEFQRGHLPRAISIPIDQLAQPDRLAQIRSRLAQQPSVQIVTYCHAGARSHRALKQLRQEGLSGKNLTGGMVAWRQQIDPTLPEPNPPAS